MTRVEIPHKEKSKSVSYFLEDKVKKKIDANIKGQLQQKDKDYVIVIDGKEGCLSADTLIKTSKGDKQIRDLCNGKEFYVESLDMNTKKNVSGKAICINSGKKELFEIETIDGRKIKATSEHTFFILRNKNIYEVKLSDLKEGDELICQ